MGSSSDLVPEPTPAGISRRAVLCGLLLPLVPGVAAADDAPAIAPLPAADQPLSRVAFGACHKLDRPFDIWDVMLARRPELFVFLGDTVYLDTVDIAAKRAEYAKLAAVPNFAGFRRRVPIVATWDDHDYGANDGGADYPKRDESQAAFLDFFHEPADSPRRKRGGVYGDWLFGPPGKRTQVLLLDTRYHRSPLRPDLQFGGYLPQRDPAATMLGDAQWRWLAEQLRVPADLRLIVSSIQVFHEEQPNEKWDNMPAERAKLFKTIADARASGVVIISGDRHHGEISAMDIGAGYTVYDLTSSGLNCPYEPQEEPNRHRVGENLWADNFGMVRVDWTEADPVIELEIHDGQGKVAMAKHLTLRELRPR